MMACHKMANKFAGKQWEHIVDSRSLSSGKEDSLDYIKDFSSEEEDSQDDNNWPKVTEDFSCYFIGTHEVQECLEGQGEVDLHTHLAKCEKNPGHKNFIPIKQLSVKHFPSGYYDNDVYDLTKALAALTVRIAVTLTSPDRPEFVPGTKDPYPCYNTRGQNSLRTGTGRVWKVTKYTEGMWGHRTCPCPECDHSDTPSKEWCGLQVMTARQVVFDSSEAKQTSCRLWFDDDRSPVVNIYGNGLSKSDTTGDWCWIECVTHDLSVGDKMRNALKRYEVLRVHVSAKMKFRTNVDKLTIIVSHPHGCSKQVSVGQWVDRQAVSGEKTRYCYNTCTCPGSCGAPVYRLGTLWSEHPHLGASDGGLNYSGEWVD